jgi:hypothetical protein
MSDPLQHYSVKNKSFMTGGISLLAHQSARKPGKSHSSRPKRKIFISRILRDEAGVVTLAHSVEI